MKKITLIILLILSFNVAFSQSMRLRKLEVIDSIYAPARINAGEYYKDGVPFSAGGGDVYLGNRQTFTGSNTFSDTLKADGLSLIDNARITSNLNITGDIISDLDFIKGSRVRIGTSDNYGLVLKTADTNRLAIDSLGFVTVNKSLSVGTYVISSDSVVSSFLVGDGVYLNGLGKAIYWRGYGSSIQEGVNALYYNVNMHYFKTKSTFTIAELDSATGLNLKYGNYYLNGTLLFDSTKYAHTDLGTEIFSNVVKFITNIVDFAAGLTTTTITASSTATFNGNVVTSGYNDFGNTGQFEKRYFFRGKMGGAGSGVVNIPHGLNWKQIIGYDCVIRNDTVGASGIVAGQPKFIKPNQWFGALLYYVKVDSLYCHAALGNGANNNLINDSIFFEVKYRQETY